jgi:hypothetical protein
MDEPHAYIDSQDSPWPELGGSHHLPFYNIICDWPQGYTQISFFPGFPNRGMKFLELNFPSLGGP